MVAMNGTYALPLKLYRTPDMYKKGRQSLTATMLIIPTNLLQTTLGASCTKTIGELYDL